MKIFSLSLCLFFLIGCAEGVRENKDKTKIEGNSNNIRVSILDSVTLVSDLNKYCFESHFNYDIFKEKKNGRTLFFDKKTGELISIKTEKNGKFTEYHFEKSNIDYHLEYYIANNKKRTSTEICVYKNLKPDIRNSVFLDVKKVGETEETVQVMVNYNSGYDFINGTIFYGKKMFTLKDSIGSLRFTMSKISQEISIPKSKIHNQDKVLNVFIERSLKREIPMIESYPAKGHHIIYGLYIKEIDL